MQDAVPMTDLWVSLIPILFADILNPVLFAFLVYAAGTDRAVLNSTAMLLGHTAAYLLVGIVVLCSISLVITPPNVSTPSESGVTSKSRMSFTPASPARTAP